MEIVVEPQLIVVDVTPQNAVMGSTQVAVHMDTTEMVVSSNPRVVHVGIQMVLDV